MPLSEGEAGSPSNKVIWAEAYLRTKWHLDPSNRFARIDIGRVLWMKACLHPLASVRRHCVKWGPSFSLPKRDTRAPLIFGPCLLWPKGWIDRNATGYGGKPRPRRHCVRWEPSSPIGAQQPQLFGPCLLRANARPSQLLLSSCFSKRYSL